MTVRSARARTRTACTIGASVRVALGAFALASPCAALESWGGSLVLTSDYLVRGISRSDHNPALQGDWHFRTAAGLIGGVFASSVQFAPDEPRSAEVSVFAGYAWRRGGDWRARALATHYSYPRNEAGSRYNYDELSVDAGYRGWLNLSFVYSPNAPRYLSSGGLTGVSATSADISLISPWRQRLAATAGAGYSRIGGPEGAGYYYWSAGVVCDLAPWSMSVAYEDTSEAAKYLFFNAAAHDRWMATLVWRF